jgi:hypothetical protein
MKEAMKLALEALEQMQAKANFKCWNLNICDEAIKALEEALAEQHLQALHDENVRLGLYERGYADAMNWKTANHLEHLPAKQEQSVSVGEPNTQSYPEKDNSQPVAWMDIENGTFSGLRYWSEPDNRHEVALYTTPQQSICLEAESTLKESDI